MTVPRAYPARSEHEARPNPEQDALLSRAYLLPYSLELGQFRHIKELVVNILGCGQKNNYSQKLHEDMKSMYKLHMSSPPAENQGFIF